MLKTTSTHLENNLEVCLKHINVFSYTSYFATTRKSFVMCKKLCTNINNYFEKQTYIFSNKCS